MANMGYCRFQNTVSDLADCEDALGELMDLDQLSSDEERAAWRLIRICRRIANDWDEDV
jgi:hypothetical protein